MVIVVLAAVFATAASAQMYKWRDSDGRIQYSDTPPPVGAKDIQRLRKDTSPAAAAPSSAARSLAEQDAEFKKRLVEKQEAQAKQAKEAQEEEFRARNCAQAKAQLAALESGARMVQLNAKGERIPIEDSERERAKQDTQKAVESWCK
jgi:hypothetical protein